MDNWRITVLGDGGVGKTALAVQYMLGVFVETYDPTIEDAYRKQTLIDDKLCFVEVIDTAGQEEYATLRDQWVREGQGFVLVYSIASRSTFERLEVFRQSMLRVKGQNPTYILVGNKCDKTQEREVSREDGAQLARKLGCEFLETSARTSHNVDRLFSTLVRTLRNNRDGGGHGNGSGGVGGGVGGVGDPNGAGGQANGGDEEKPVRKPKKKKPGCVVC